MSDHIGPVPDAVKARLFVFERDDKITPELTKARYACSYRYMMGEYSDRAAAVTDLISKCYAE
jgi:hypothetical protein